MHLSTSIWNGTNAKTKNWQGAVRSWFLPSLVELRSVVAKIKSKLLQQIRGQDCHPEFPISREKLTFGRGQSDIEIKSKLYKPIRGQRGHLGFPPINTTCNLVEDVEILLPVKSHGIPLSSCRDKVEIVSANHMPGRPYCFSDRLEKKNHKPAKDVKILLPVKFRWIPFSGFRGEVKNVKS